MSLLLFSLVACMPHVDYPDAEGAADGATPGGPGGPAPDSPDVSPEAEEAETTQLDVSCAEDSECLGGEVCGEGVCQVDHCGSIDRTDPPLGDLVPLIGEAEVVLYDLHRSDALTYNVSGQHTSFYSQEDTRDSDPVDVAGGHLLGARPEALAVAREGSSQVSVVHPTGDVTVSVGLHPVALGVGDADGDGQEEIFAVATDGEWSVCSALDGGCIAGGDYEGGEVLDAEAGDVDGDGLDELVLTAETDDGWGRVVVLNVIQGADAAPFMMEAETYSSRRCTTRPTTRASPTGRRAWATARPRAAARRSTADSRWARTAPWA